MTVHNNHIRAEIKNWLKMVEYDLATAQQMFKTGRYIYVIFMCHLATEKALKTILIAKTNNLPPKTHNLIYLTDLTKIKLSKDLLDFVGMINDASIVTRYPENLAEIIKNYPKEVTKRYLNKSIEVIECVKKELKSIK